MTPTTSQLLPLELPELVAATLQYITDPRDLRACILVNKLWASEATTLLWEDNPPIKAFVDIPAFKEPERLQLYAKKVRKFTLNADDARYNHLFAYTEFPRLETIVLDSSPYNEVETLLPFLQPSLRKFFIYGGPVGDTLLYELRIRSPHLEDLLIDNARNNLTAKGLQDFLTKMSSLKKLHVMYGLNHALTDEVICHLAERTSLVHLDFTKLIRQEVAHNLVNSSAHPFEHLKTLTCTAESKAFALLTPHLLRLEILRLSLLETLDTVLSAIAHCPKISHVEVRYLIATVPPPSEIIHLADKHQNLQTLQLRWQDDGLMTTEEAQSDPYSLDDASIDTITSKLRSIKILTLWFPLSADVSTKALESIGKHCKALERCKLPGTFNMSKLPLVAPLYPEIPLETCLFPNLLDLTIRRASNRDQGSAQHAVRALRAHAPKLQEFEAVQDDNFTNMVERAIRPRSGLDTAGWF
ncbi:MAG: hypothetical protein M1836_005183 [Candelina mexicana]|nr:MAG: hypothetical protein M1836_005183 [Candelina mexicana]